MCLLTFFPEGVYPSHDEILGLTRGAKANPDGHGYAMITGDSILTRKGMDADEIIDQFLIDRVDNLKGPAIFHSRIGTDGFLDEANCHPFYVGNDKRTVLAHNGILPKLARPTSMSDPRSDTRILSEVLLPEKPFGYFHSRLAREAFEEWLGLWNKVIILTTNPRYPSNVIMFNEKSGTWDGEVWWSNESYLPFRKKTTGIYVPKDDDKRIILGKVLEEEDPVSLICIECKEPAVDKQYRVCWNCSTCQDCLGNYTKGECLCYIPSRGMGNTGTKSDKNTVCIGCSKGPDDCLCCEL